MSLLEDFKRYADREIDGGVTHRDGEPACACVVLPRVIAVLGAAERMVAPRVYTDTEAFVGVPADQLRVVDAAAYDALVAALRGEGVTA